MQLSSDTSKKSGTAWVQRTGPSSRGSIRSDLARITGVEVCAAIMGRVRLGTVVPPAAAASLARFRLDLSQEYLVLEITAPLLTDAMRLVEAHGIRAYDAVQLAAWARAEWPVAGRRNGKHHARLADLDLNTAATAEGLLVEDPNLHR